MSGECEMVQLVEQAAEGGEEQRVNEEKVEAKVEENQQQETDDDDDDEIPFDLDKIKWHEVFKFNEPNQEAAAAEGAEGGGVPVVVNEKQLKWQHKVEKALRIVMPWNDAKFAMINVRSDPIDESSFPPMDPLEVMQRNLGATIQVKIGWATFWCIPKLLEQHSRYFKKYVAKCDMFDFVEGKDLTAMGFRSAYDWMRLQVPLSQTRSTIVQLLHSAYQLKMDELIMLCHRYLCSKQFMKRTAVQVYMQASRYIKMEPLRQLMLQRVGVYFLALVGSNSYLQMPVHDVWVMLQQSSLGVNTELEILYGIIRWLAADTTGRACHVPLLMQCVRFTRLPLRSLKDLWGSFSVATRRGDVDSIAKAFRQSQFIRRRVKYALSVVQLEHHYRDRNRQQRRRFLAALRSRGMAYDPPREWVYDEHCDYHLPRPRSPYMHRVEIGDFMAYIKIRADKEKGILERAKGMGTEAETSDSELESSSSSSSVTSHGLCRHWNFGQLQKQLPVRPFESYVKQTQEIIAQLLTKINGKKKPKTKPKKNQDPTKQTHKLSFPVGRI